MGSGQMIVQTTCATHSAYHQCKLQGKRLTRNIQDGKDELEPHFLHQGSSGRDIFIAVKAIDWQ